MVQRVADRFAELKSALELAEVQAKKERVADEFYRSSLVLQVVEAWGREAPLGFSSSSSSTDGMTEWCEMNDGYTMNAPIRTAMNARHEAAMKAAIKAGMRRWLGGTAPRLGLHSAPPSSPATTMKAMKKAATPAPAAPKKKAKKTMRITVTRLEIRPPRRRVLERREEPPA